MSNKWFLSVLFNLIFHNITRSERMFALLPSNYCLFSCYCYSGLVNFIKVFCVNLITVKTWINHRPTSKLLNYPFYPKLEVGKRCRYKWRIGFYIVSTDGSLTRGVTIALPIYKRSPWIWDWHHKPLQWETRIRPVFALAKLSQFRCPFRSLRIHRWVSDLWPPLYRWAH